MPLLVRMVVAKVTLSIPCCLCSVTERTKFAAKSCPFWFTKVRLMKMSVRVPLPSILPKLSTNPTVPMNSCQIRDLSFRVRHSVTTALITRSTIVVSISKKWQKCWNNTASIWTTIVFSFFKWVNSWDAIHTFSNQTYFTGWGRIDCYDETERCHRKWMRLTGILGGHCWNDTVQGQFFRKSFDGHRQWKSFFFFNF